MSKVLTSPQLPSGRRITVDDQGSNAEVDVIVEEISGGGGGLPVPAISHFVFASPLFGDDTTGYGTMSQPYATVAMAQSVVTGASLTDLWEIVMLPGEYIEDVVLTAFVRIMGWDPSADQGSVQAARLNGTLSITTGTGWDASLAFSAVSNVYIDGDITLDYTTAASPTGGVSFTNCNCAGNVELTQGATNQTEFHACTFDGGDFVQLGGTVAWVGSAGTSNVTHLRVAGNAGTATLFDASGGGWAGDLHADQNAVSDQDVTINMRGFNVALATRVTSAVAKNPTVNGAMGATLENPTLDGSSAAALSPQMRVSVPMFVASGAVIGPTSTTNVLVPLAGGILGDTSIEDMVCACILIGADWVTLGALHALSVSWVFVDNAGTNEIHCLIYSGDQDGFTTAVNLPFTFSAYLPGS